MRHLGILCFAVVSMMCIVGVLVDTERRQSIYDSLDLLETDDYFLPPPQSCEGVITRHLAPAVSHRILDALKQCDGRDIVTELGTTPLMAGAWEGDAALVGECLRQKHETEVIDRFGNTALYYAVRSGRRQVVQRLGKSALNTTPPHPARFAQRQVVQMLVDAGADVVCLNDHGETPLTLAVEQDRPDLLTALASRPRSFSRVPELRYEFTDAWCWGVEEAIEANSGPDRLAQNRAEIESRCETLRQAAALFPQFIDPQLIRSSLAGWSSLEKRQVDATLTALALPAPTDSSGSTRISLKDWDMRSVPRWVYQQDGGGRRPIRSTNALFRRLVGTGFYESSYKRTCQRPAPKPAASH